MPSTNGHTPPRRSGLAEFTLPELAAELARRGAAPSAFGFLADLRQQAHDKANAGGCPGLRRKHAQVFHSLTADLRGIVSGQ